MAETEGFEPSVRFPVRRFSKALVSATHPRLRLRQADGYSGPTDGFQQGLPAGARSPWRTSPRLRRVAHVFIAGQRGGWLTMPDQGWRARDAVTIC